MKFLDKFKINIRAIPAIEVLSVLVLMLSAASHGIDVQNIIAREAAGFLPALA